MRCKEQIRLYKYLFQELKKRGGISDEGKEERGGNERKKIGRERIYKNERLFKIIKEADRE